MSRWVRLSKPVTALLGPRYGRHKRVVQIELTWQCNLRCENCDRSCQQAPTGEHLTLEQLDRFLEESVSRGIEWDALRLLGGEPTLHPEFEAVIERLRAHRDEQRVATVIEVRTNGHGARVRRSLSELPEDVKVVDSAKGSSAQPTFKLFNAAPADGRLHGLFDYGNGCSIPRRCGTAFDPYGFYPCGVAAGIDRVFGFDLGRKQLPDDTDEMRDLMRIFCALCGHFLGTRPRDRRELVSASWRSAYRDWRERSPRMTRY